VTSDCGMYTVWEYKIISLNGFSLPDSDMTYPRTQSRGASLR